MNYLENISLKKLITLIKTEIKNNSGGSAVEYTATIGTDWTGETAPYTQEIAVAGILTDDDPIVDLTFSEDYTTDQTRLAEWSKIYRIVTTADEITVYATDKTSIALPIQLQVVR